MNKRKLKRINGQYYFEKFDWKEAIKSIFVAAFFSIVFWIVLAFVFVVSLLINNAVLNTTGFEVAITFSSIFLILFWIIFSVIFIYDQEPKLVFLKIDKVKKYAG